MTRVGLRELKQNPSQVISRVEQGETIEVTVQGRPAALLVPIGGRARRRWVPAAEFAALTPIADVAEWAAEIRDSRENDSIVDPWESR
ncbi:type II toxin-antitoxin system prevent-host-death family antitoxin [Cryobacterium glaciale]|uniref:Antitoxin n=1 Tax=Cryobacterium glaciale TaxID=1259145 RepID=A0A4R8UV47_9MICO|nr:type II toxin-antitoxin system prevent-host-death family antitoxin [Cryobacterium glaciale]TFB71903.1 type II toxin-antitoxin system prevent-host-death family antitoxin [Cryobacterium glaciale]